MECCRRTFGSYLSGIAYTYVTYSAGSRGDDPRCVSYVAARFVYGRVEFGNRKLAADIEGLNLTRFA